MNHRGTLLLKRGLLGFWAAWLTLIATTNVFDALKALGWIDPSRAFASGNFDYITQATARYAAPGWLNGVLFSGVIAWETLIALAYWLALMRYRGRDSAGMAIVRCAFGLSFGLWAAFILVDEVLIAYKFEDVHVRILVTQLVTLLVVELVPEV